MIFDTCFIIDLLKEQESAIKKLKEIEKAKLSLGLSSISIVELWSGIARSNISEKEKRKIKKILQSRLIVEFDSESAKIAGTIHGRLHNEGKPINANDAMIAGIAISNGETLLTRNGKHFNRIEELKIETY